MATKALNYTTAEINQRLNLAGTAVQPNALNDYYTKTEVNGIESELLNGLKKVQIEFDNVSGEDVDLFVSTTCTDNSIIKNGNSLDIQTSSYYCITDYIEIKDNLSYYLKGITTGTFNDGGSIALFSGKNDNNFIKAVTIKSMFSTATEGSIDSLLAENPTTKYVRITLRAKSPDDRSTFQFLEKGINVFDDIKEIENALGNKYDKRTEIIDEFNYFSIDGFSSHKKMNVSNTSVYAETDTNYYGITDFLPIDSAHEFVFSGFTTTNYYDNNYIAVFSARNTSSFLGYIPFKAGVVVPTQQSILTSYPTAKYVKVTLRDQGTLDKNTFVWKATLDLLKGRVSALETEIGMFPIGFNKNVKIATLGDSFTQLGLDNNRGFIYFAITDLGLNKTDNIYAHGIGGTKLTQCSRDTTDTNAMVERIENVPNADVFTLLGGINDTKEPFNSWEEKKGSISDGPNKYTLIGALRYIVERYIEKYPYTNAQFLFMTYPYYANSTQGAAVNDALRQVAEYYGFPLLDFDKICRFKAGFNAQLGRADILEGVTFTDGKQINYNNGTTFINDKSWCYCEDYIAIDPLYRYYNEYNNNQSNVLCYKYEDNAYTYLGYGGGRDGMFKEGTTHIRMNIKVSQKPNSFLKYMDGEFVSDNVHPNLLGFKKMYPYLREMLKELMNSYIVNY